MTNPVMEEIFTLSEAALFNGQERIQVHVFPFRMTQANLHAHASSPWLGFWSNLKEAYDAFERTSVPPQVSVCGNRYLIGQAPDPELLRRQRQRGERRPAADPLHAACCAAGASPAGEGGMCGRPMRPPGGRAWRRMPGAARPISADPCGSARLADRIAASSAGDVEQLHPPIQPTGEIVKSSTGRQPETGDRDNAKEPSSDQRRPRGVSAQMQHLDLGGLDQFTGYVVRRAQVWIFQDFKRVLRKFDITPAQFAVVKIVAANPGVVQAQGGRGAGHRAGAAGGDARPAGKARAHRAVALAERSALARAASDARGRRPAGAPGPIDRRARAARAGPHRRRRQARAVAHPAAAAALGLSGVVCLRYRGHPETHESEAAPQGVPGLGLRGDPVGYAGAGRGPRSAAADEREPRAGGLDCRHQQGQDRAAEDCRRAQCHEPAPLPIPTRSSAAHRCPSRCSPISSCSSSTRACCRSTSRCARIVPDFVPKDPQAATITVRQVLSHTTGLPNWRNVKQPLKTHFPPGEKFSYSGEAFLWLQRVVQAKTGEGIDTLAQRLVFGPLRMRRSSFVWRPEFDANFADPHDADLVPVPKYKSPTAKVAGSLQTTAADYARFLLAVMSGARLKPATARLWLRPQVRLQAAVLPVHRLHRARGRPARRLGARLGARARRRHVLPLGRCGALHELRGGLGGQARGRGGARQWRQRHGDHAGAGRRADAGRPPRVRLAQLPAPAPAAQAQGGEGGARTARSKEVKDSKGPAKGAEPQKITDPKNGKQAK